MIKIGDEKLVKTLGIRGKVVYIDYPNLFNEWMFPIQLELEETWYDGEGTNCKMYRCGLSEVEIEVDR